MSSVTRTVLTSLSPFSTKETRIASLSLASLVVATLVATAQPSTTFESAPAPAVITTQTASPSSSSIANAA